MTNGASLCPSLPAAGVQLGVQAAILQSAIYTGQVDHCRSESVSHEFRYRLFYLYLDLAELEQVFTDRWFWSVERPNWASFRRSDHLRSSGPLKSAVRDEVARQLGFRPTGPIRILTHLRYLGYCFNPISIYYCFAVDGIRLEAIVTEVHNTPWGEEYVRALDARGGPRDAGWYVYLFDKESHVSPFMPRDISYEWRFTYPDGKLGVQMENTRQGNSIFTAELALERRPLTGENLAAALMQWPCITARVMVAIYWQALRLKLKGLTFYPHQGHLP